VTSVVAHRKRRSPAPRFDTETARTHIFVINW